MYADEVSEGLLRQATVVSVCTQVVAEAPLQFAFHDAGRLSPAYSSVYRLISSIPAGGGAHGTTSVSYRGCVMAIGE